MKFDGSCFCVFYYLVFLPADAMDIFNKSESKITPNLWVMYVQKLTLLSCVCVGFFVCFLKSHCLRSNARPSSLLWAERLVLHPSDIMWDFHSNRGDIILLEVRHSTLRLYERVHVSELETSIEFASMQVFVFVGHIIGVNVDWWNLSHRDALQWLHTGSLAERIRSLTKKRLKKKKSWQRFHSAENRFFLVCSHIFNPVMLPYFQWLSLWYVYSRVNRSQHTKCGQTHHFNFNLKINCYQSVM